MAFDSILKPIHPIERKDFTADVVFIHGLNSNAKDCWTAEGGAFWPSWLAEDFKGLGVWTIDYGAAASDWFSDRKPMPIYQRAINLLELLKVHELGERPLVFIAHSMGGLMAKQMLRFAMDESKDTDYKRIGAATRGSSLLRLRTKALVSGTG